MKNIKIIFSMLILMTLGLGSCNDDLAEPPVNNPGIHYGVWDDPMSVYQVSLGTVTEGYDAVWVTGYIVGCVNTNISNTCSEATADFTTPAPVQTNILMAETPDEKDWSKCITVQLPSGPVRQALNMGNAANKGKQVTILGTVGKKYCSVYGVRAVSAYVWGDKGDSSIDIVSKPGTTPTPTPGDGTVVYESLANTLTGIPSDWTIDNVKLPEGKTEIWSWKEYNGKGYLYATAYGATGDGLAYAITPVIDLTDYTGASASFRHAAKFQTTIKELCGFAVREAGTTEWTDITIPNWPPLDNKWTWAESGEMDLSAFAGKKVQVAFKYGCSAAGADSWEINDLKVTGIK